MGVRLVRQPAIRPHRCALVPFIGASNEPGGFFDFGTSIDAWDGHVYVSMTAFRQMAEAVGWAPARADQRDREIRELKERLDVAERELAAAEKALEAVKTLKAAGFTASRGPGRPKGPRKETTMEAA